MIVITIVYIDDLVARPLNLIPTLDDMLLYMKKNNDVAPSISFQHEIIWLNQSTQTQPEKDNIHFTASISNETPLDDACKTLQKKVEELTQGSDPFFVLIDLALFANRDGQRLDEAATETLSMRLRNLYQDHAELYTYQLGDDLRQKVIRRYKAVYGTGINIYPYPSIANTDAFDLNLCTRLVKRILAANNANLVK